MVGEHPAQFRQFLVTDTNRNRKLIQDNAIRLVTEVISNRPERSPFMPRRRPSPYAQTNGPESRVNANHF
jgi:hypothetical protein